MSEEKAATCVAGGLKTTAWEPVLTMASNNGISATVQWTLPKGKRPERFELTWYNRDESITRPTLSNEYQISLKPGYTYTATVVGVNSSGISKQSKPITIQAKPLGPVNVTLASNQLSNTNSIIAKWIGTDTRVTNYWVTAIELSTGTMKCNRSTICTCTLTDLKPGRFYRVYIEALLLEGPLLPKEVVLQEEAAVMLEEVVLPGEAEQMGAVLPEVVVLPEKAVPPEGAVLHKEDEQMELISERAFSQEDIQTYPAKVQNLKEEAVASGSYNFSWDTVIGATSYEFALKNSETNYVSHLSDHPEFVCSGLQLGMRYTAKVAAINGAGKGEYSKPVQFATSPEAPTAVRVNIDDHDSSLLHVDITEPAMKPDLYEFQLIENGKEHEPKTVQKPSHTFSGLKPAREYSVSVHSLSGGLESRTRYSSAVQTCPEKVGGLELAGMTNSSLTVKWKNTPGAVSYRVRCTDEEQNQKVRVTELTKCVIDGLEPGKNYNISVTATNRIQSGKCSDELSVRMAPRVVTDIQVTNYAAMPHECLVVTFKDDNTKKNGYCVVAQPLSGGDDTVQETDKPSALIKGLTPGETYNIYVVVVDEEELESSREYYRDAVQTYPAAPKDVELVFTDSQLKFTWRHPNFKPDRYKVTWIANGDAFSAEVDETRFVLNNLSPSMTYRFSAAAINQAGMGEASDVQEYITAPAAPMNVHASVNPDSPETSFIVEYDDPDPPDPEKRYEVFACPTSGEGPEVSQISDNRRALLQDLVPGEAYHIYVVAIRGELRSEKAYRVSYPKMIQAEDISLEDFSPWGTSAAVVWPPSKADHYAIRWWSTGGEVKEDKTEAPVYIIHDLMPGSTYRMQVAALNEEGKGEYSKERQIRTAPVTVHSVQLCNSPKAPETSLIVRFEDDDASPKTYRVVIRGLSAGEEIPKETLTTFAYMEGLVPGEEYEAFVHVIKDGLQSKPCFTENSRRTLPAKVGKLNVTGATPGSQNISWPPVFGAESYIFEWRRSDRNYSQTPTKQTEHTLEHLESGQAYVARVVAINSAGQGEYSKPVEFMTDLVSPRNVEAKVRYSGEDILVDVKFVKSPHKVKHYNIGEVSEHVQPIQTPTCSGTLSGFDHGKKYNIFVEAEAENGAKSDRMFANTILTKPGRVRLQSEAISKSCEKIFWDHAFGATSYIVRGVSDEDLPVHGTEIPLKDLPPDHTFSVSVSAVNDSGSGDFSEPLIFWTASVQPNDIRVANCASKAQERITVSCLPPHEPSDYKLKVSIVEVSTNVIADCKEVEEWHATFQNLEPGTQYYAKLQFLHKTIATRNSDEATSEPFWTCCSKIVGLKATFIAHDKYLIEWKKVAGATKYFIRYRPENGSFADFCHQSAECTLNNLVLGQKYTVIVAAVNGASDREQSETVTFHTGWGAPTQVEVYRNEQNPDTSIDIRFTEPQSKPHVYLVTATATSAQYCVTVQTNENFTTIHGLHPGIEYAIHVQSLDENNEKLSSGESETVTRFTCPDKVNDLELTVESARSRNASWEPAVGATLYQIMLRKTGCRPQIIEVDGKKSEHVIENLCLNTYYKISIAAINSAGRGRESKEQTFQTALFPPSRLAVKLNEIKPMAEVDLNFEFPKPPATKYRIRAENLHGKPDVLHFTEKNFMKIGDLNPGERYKFYVCSVNENDENLNSEEIESSEISMCQVKFLINIYKIANIQQKVWWDDVPGIKQYEVAWRIQNEVEWQREQTKQNAFILKNLMSGKHYEVKASPITMGRKGEESEIKKFTTAPGKPVNLTSKTTSPSEVLFTCKSCPGATSYEFTIISESHEENPKPYTKIAQSPQLRFRCTGNDTKFQAYVRAINGGGISGQSDIIELRQVLRHLQLKFLSQAKNHLPQEKFIMPQLATLPDQNISNDFKACINPGESETVLMVGGLFCGKTACCSYFLQTQDSKQLCLLLDYDSIKSVERDFKAKTDIKSLLWKYMPDITSEEMDFVYQWMKEHSQHVTLVVDNFALPADFQVKHIQHEDKETPQVLFYNLLKTNRDTFPKSHIFCTTSQTSVSSWLKPTASYRMHGFDHDGVKEMRLQVLGPQKPTSSNIDIPSQMEYFSRHPGSCEIVWRLSQQNGSTSDETDCTSLASVQIEILSQNIARHSEQDKAIKLKQLYKEIMKVPQKIYNTKIDPQKINRVKGKPRKYAPVESNDDCSSYSNVSSVLETPRRRNAMNSLLPSCDILDDICLKALYFGVFATADEFKKHFSKRQLKFSSTSYVWIMTAGMLRQHTSKKAAKLFQPVTKIEMNECEKKAEQFKTFVKKNLKDILTSVYTDSQITLDWFACCAELDDEKLLETCTLEIKVKDDMSTAAGEEVTKFLESVPKQFCRQVKIRVKEGTGTIKTVPINAAIKRNPNGRLFDNVNYKRSSISLSRKGSQRSNLSRNDSRNQADVTFPTMPSLEEGILNSEDTIEAQARSPSGTVHEEVFEPEEKLVVKPEKGEDGGENSGNIS